MLTRELPTMPLVACAALLACRATAVYATEIVASSPATRSDSGARPEALNGEQFPRGTWTVQLDGAFVHDFTNRSFEQFAGGHVGIGYYLFDRLSVNADLPVYWVNQSGPKTAAAGFDLLARWHFVEQGRLSLYLDGGAGLLVSDHDVPRGGTHFNFTPQIGLGATWLLDEHMFLIGGARLWHLSNAGFDGHDRNPSVDGSLIGYVGIGWRF